LDGAGERTALSPPTGDLFKRRKQVALRESRFKFSQDATNARLVEASAVEAPWRGRIIEVLWTTGEDVRERHHPGALDEARIGDAPRKTRGLHRLSEHAGLIRRESKVMSTSALSRGTP
jgi:hypothetical protein